MKKVISALVLILCVTGCGMPELYDPRSGNITPSTGPTGSSHDDVEILFIDVGQGDSTLLISPDGEAVLIDAGAAGAGYAAVLPAIRDAAVDSLKAIIATHYHADHIGGIAEVLSDFTPTEGIFDRGGSYEGSGSAWESYLAAAGNTRRTVYPGDRIDLGQISVEVVAADGMLADASQIALEPFDENSASIALLIEYEDFRMYVGGDLTGGGGTPPYETIDLETPLGILVGDIDVLQVNHHGSKTSSNQAFLNSVTPEIAVISCGNANDYFHPHKSVIDRLLDSGIDIYQTERCWTDSDADVVIANGNITLTTDGSNYFLTTPM